MMDAVVVVLAALDLEYAAVRERLIDPRRHDHPAGTVFEVGRLPGGFGPIALGVTGEGNTGAAVVADRAIAMFCPRALVLVGVAGALRDDIGLGDVVVATKVYAYHGGSAQPDGFRSRPRSWEIPHHLDQLARHVHHTGRWMTDFPAPPRATRVSEAGRCSDRNRSLRRSDMYAPQPWYVSTGVPRRAPPTSAGTTPVSRTPGTAHLRCLPARPPG
jgi:adenosylhomocysteine nucleosidase